MRVSIIALATILQLAAAKPELDWGQQIDALEHQEQQEQAPLRKRTQSLHKSHEGVRRVSADEAYDAYLGIALKDGQGNENPQQQRGQRRRRNQETCSFCPSGLAVDPSFEIPGSGVTCGLVLNTVGFLEAGGEDCDSAQMAQMVCCPADYVDPAATAALSMSMPMSMSMSMPPAAMCSFCADGVLNPDIVLTDPDTGLSATCAFTQTVLAALAEDDPMCLDGKTAELICCPTGDEVIGELGPGPVLPIETTTSTTEAPPEPVTPSLCSFCPNGLANPDFILPTDDEATCAQAAGFAASLNPEDATCTTVQLAEAFCCPDVPVNLPETTAAPPAVTLPELTDGQCSCSPLVYNFELAFDQNCDVDDLEGKPGIGLTFCFLGSSSVGGRRRLSSSSSLRRLKKEDKEEAVTISKEDSEVRFIEFENPAFAEPLKEELERRLVESLEVISIQFLEFDTSGELIVINQDDTYSNTSLVDGDIITFKSIANDLDPDMPIEDQLDLLPGGVQVTLRGLVFDEETSETKIVSNRITWSYTNACDVIPIEGGESIGWTTTTDLTPASDAFCPALRTTTTVAATDPPATTTEAPPATTEAPPATTEEPPATTTEAPPATTEAPPATTEEPPATTGAPPATTEAPPATEVPPSTEAPPMFGKSGKGGKSSTKSSKNKKKSSVSPKTNKTPKNPMAKVHKDSSKDDGHQDDASSPDAKSGKAKVDLDTKAEKATGNAKKESSNEGKSGKLTKSSSKGAKSKSAKSDSSKGESSKGPKATKLFKETPLHDGSTAATPSEEGSMSL